MRWLPFLLLLLLAACIPRAHLVGVDYETGEFALCTGVDQNDVDGEAIATCKRDNGGDAYTLRCGGPATVVLTSATGAVATNALRQDRWCCVYRCEAAPAK